MITGEGVAVMGEAVWMHRCYSTAIHEAGHAVVALALGQGFHQIAYELEEGT